MIARACGIDVHQAELTACVRIAEDGKVVQHVESFGTTVPDLLALHDWLAAHQVTHVAMESTGVYWKTVYYALEDDFTVLLVNAMHIKHVPGRPKTDMIDAAWIAQLLAHGLLRPSFVPPAPIRRLRDLTRYRKALIQERSREVNRIHKTLEDAGVKLSSVATDIMGVSGRAMMRALVEGTTDATVLADLAKGRLRAKLADLHKALTGRFKAHHAFLLERMLAHVTDLEADIEALSERITAELSPFEQKAERLDSITGVGARAAEVLIAELGVDMSVFPTEKHCASWARICPGQHESAGKRRNVRTGKGDKWLRTTLIECANAAAKSKNTYMAERYRQLMRRRGHRKAIVAIAHEILIAAWRVLATDEPYLDPGPHAARRNSQDATRQRAIRQLHQLGYRVTLEPLPEAS